MRHILRRCIILFLLGLPLASFLFCGSGCIEQTLSVETNPPGALVDLNDQEIGRTPTQRDFTWWGVYDVTIRKEGYLSIKTTAKVIAPFYEWVPLDFLVDILPFKIKYHKTLRYNLQADVPTTGQAPDLIRRGEELSKELESTRLPPAASQPAK
jgi:hypothetical protein